MDLKLEYNSEFIEANTTHKYPNATIIVTPPVSEKYFIFRVKLSKTQSIIGFPKFGTIGIGFAKETNWNTNLPYECKATEIFAHIKENKGSKTISDADCLKAIDMVRKAAILYKAVTKNKFANAN